MHSMQLRVSHRGETQNPLCAHQILCQTALATSNASSKPQQRTRDQSRTSKYRCSPSASPKPPATFSFIHSAGTQRATHAHCHMRIADVAPRLPGSVIFEHEVKVQAAMVRFLTANFSRHQPRFVELRKRHARHVGCTDQGVGGGGHDKPRHLGTF